MLINNIGIQLYISKTWKIKKIRKSCGKKIELLSNPSLRTLLYPYHKNNKEMVLIEDDRWWKSTLEGRWPSMADTIRWKTSFDGRGPSNLVQDDPQLQTNLLSFEVDLWWNTWLNNNNKKHYCKGRCQKHPEGGGKGRKTLISPKNC